MYLLRTFLFAMACVVTATSHAQYLQTVPISTAPYYFYGQSSYGQYPQIAQPYQLPNYWQQQQPSAMMSLMPALSQLTSMIGNDLDKGPKTGDIVDLEDNGRGSSRRQTYRTPSEFTFTAKIEDKGIKSVAVPRPATTGQSSTSSYSGDCEECRRNQGSQPTVLSSSTTSTAVTSVAAANEIKDAALLRYQDSAQVKKLVESIRSGSLKARNERRHIYGAKASSKSLGRCLMYVKFGLKDAGFYRNYPGGKYASNFGGSLEAQGFTNLMDEGGYHITDPDKAPIGSVIVYESTPGTKTPGHIEVKLGPNEYGSDYIDDEPRSDTSTHRKVIGIYVKLPAGDA